MSNEPAYQQYPGPGPGEGEGIDPHPRPEFSEIVRLHGPALHGRALWLAKSPSDAADLFQETIERALRRPRRELRSETVLRWLYTIMHNAFLDSCRARTVRRLVPLDRKLEERLSGEELPAPARWRQVDDGLLHRCIARLPDRLRAVVQMHLQGLTYTELARRLALPTSTVGTRLLRAKRRLRDLLGSFFPEESGQGNKSSPPRNAGGGHLAS